MLSPRHHINTAFFKERRANAFFPFRSAFQISNFVVCASFYQFSGETRKISKTLNLLIPEPRGFGGVSCNLLSKFPWFSHCSFEMIKEDEIDEVLLDPALSIDVKDVGEYKADELPINGHQYLHGVMKEAGKLPSVVVAEINRQRFKSKQTVYVPERETFNVSQKYLPSEEWQKQQVAAFDETRKTVSNIRSGLTAIPKFELPDYKSSDEEWYDMLWKSGVEEPSLQYMLAFNQTNLDLALKYFCTWLEESEIEFDTRSCLWIYSILACLEIPLMPSTFASLRTLAQLAIKRRARTVQSESEPVEKEISRLNLLICIVGRYFKQVDLADN